MELDFVAATWGRNLAPSRMEVIASTKRTTNEATRTAQRPVHSPVLYCILVYLGFVHSTLLL